MKNNIGNTMEIFVGNLPFEVSQQEIESLFAQHGAVSNIKMLTDRETGRFRGIAFVTMDDVAQGQAAIKALHGYEIGGRAMKVEASQPREKRDFGGNGGGGFRKPFGGGRSFGGGNDRNGGGRSFGKRY